MVKLRKLAVIIFPVLVGVAVLTSSGCSRTEAKTAAPQPLPVKTQTVTLAPVPRVDEYVATVKSRRSASIQPQVDGSLTRILVKSGDHVRAGQVLMTIDPLKQQATVDQQSSTETQKRATFEYNQQEVERQRQLYEAGVTSKQNYDLAVQAYKNSKADWESSTAARVTQQRQLAYYNLTAPFDGVVGDIPVLAVTRIGGQAFVYIATQADQGTVAKQRAVTLGDTIGNEYSVTAGLKPGEKVITSGIQ